MSFQRFELTNKTKVFLVPLKDTQSVTVLVVYPVGSRYESKELMGASHFIEHLMFKGTKKRPNTLALTREIDRLGAEYNAFTGKEATGYYIKTDARYIETALDILSDMLQNSLFDAKEMDREKGVIVEELRMYKDNPVMSIGSVFESLLFQNCPLHNDIGGTEQSVKELNRAEVLEYHSKYYSPNNATVIVAGNIGIDIEIILNKYFVQKFGGNYTEIIQKFTPAKFGSREKEKRLKIENKKTDQVQLMLGFPGLNYTDGKNSILAVLNTVLGGSMSSRLFIQIRERRGLAYMIHSGSDNYRDSGYEFVRAGLEAKNLDKAIEVVKDEIEKIKSKGVTLRELKDAKTHIRGGMTLSLEDSATQAHWYANQSLFMDQIKTPEERLGEVDKVTNEDIIKLAKKVFDFNEMRLAIIGELNQIDIGY